VARWGLPVRMTIGKILEDVNSTINTPHTWRYLSLPVRAESRDTHSECSKAPDPYCVAWSGLGLSGWVCCRPHEVHFGLVSDHIYASPACGVGRHFSAIHVYHHDSGYYASSRNRPMLRDIARRGNMIPSSLGGLRSANLCKPCDRSKSMSSKLAISVLARGRRSDITFVVFGFPFRILAREGLVPPT
jgi:hypothetical protein